MSGGEIAIYILIGVLIAIFARVVVVTFLHERSAQKRRKRTPVSGNADPELEDERVHDRGELIVDRARERGEITNDNVQAMFKVSHTTAWRLLEKLERQGKLEQLDTTGRGVTYRPLV